MTHVAIFNEQTEVALDTSLVPSIVEFVLAQEKQHSDEVTIYFVSEQEICRLHQEFFNDPTPTDCISFPMDNEDEGGPHLLGDIFICPKVAFDYVNTQPTEHDGFAEVTLYLIHGLLHLLGYRDDEDPLREEMHTLQNHYLHSLITKKILIK